MIAMKYAPHAHTRDASFVSFALGYLFAMAEMGLYCPLCMTDGVASVLTRHGTREQIERIVRRLASTNVDTLWTGGMFLTERAGGSDVGANETVASTVIPSATQRERSASHLRRPSSSEDSSPSSQLGTTNAWRLAGQKWFCSNVDAEVVLTTARPIGAEEGIRGIRTYLLMTRGNDGVVIDRLKDKLGVRSMPTGEVTLHDAPAEELGDFHVIAEMMNLSRLYNAVASVAVIGRAIREARWYIERRRAFGRNVIDHPLARETILDLEAQHLGALLLTFDTVDALRRDDAPLLRILTPIAKAVTGKLAVACVSEAMELMGGNGYIEDWVMPRLLRDAQVLPIWEGTTNILVLDALRVARKERTHELLGGGELPDERDAKRWLFALARDYMRKRLREIGEEEMAERL